MTDIEDEIAWLHQQDAGIDLELVRLGALAPTPDTVRRIAHLHREKDHHERCLHILFLKAARPA